MSLSVKLTTGFADPRGDETGVDIPFVPQASMTGKEISGSLHFGRDDNSVAGLECLPVNLFAGITVAGRSVSRFPCYGYHRIVIPTEVEGPAVSLPRAWPLAEIECFFSESRMQFISTG